MSIHLSKLEDGIYEFKLRQSEGFGYSPSKYIYKDTELKPDIKSTHQSGIITGLRTETFPFLFLTPKEKEIRMLESIWVEVKTINVWPNKTYTYSQKNPKPNSNPVNYFPQGDMYRANEGYGGKANRSRVKVPAPKKSKYTPTSRVVVKSINGITRARKVWLNKDEKEYVRVNEEGKFIYKRA